MKRIKIDTTQMKAIPTEELNKLFYENLRKEIKSLVLDDKVSNEDFFNNLMTIYENVKDAKI